MKLLENKTNVDAPDAENPEGKIRDNEGLNDGTGLDVEIYGDIHQMIARMTTAWSGLGFESANGQVDNVTNGFQTYDALLSNARIANNGLFNIVAQTILGAGVFTDPNAPYVFFGLVDDGSAVSSGFVYFQDNLFVCAGLNYGTLGNTLVYTITAENVLTLTDAAPGSGAFDHDDLVDARKDKPRLVQIRGSQIIPIGTSNALIKLDFAQQIRINNFSEWDIPLGRHIPKRSGFYEYSIKLVFTFGTSLSDLMVVQIRKNGVNLDPIIQQNAPLANTLDVIYATYIVEMDSKIGDFVDFTINVSTNPEIPIFDGLITAKYLPHG